MTDRGFRRKTSTLLYSNSRLSLVAKTEDSRSSDSRRHAEIEQRVCTVSSSPSCPLVELYEDPSLANSLKQYQGYFDRFDARVSLLVEDVRQVCIIDGRLTVRSFLQTQATIKSRQGIVLTNQEIVGKLNRGAIEDKISSLLMLLESVHRLELTDSDQMPLTKKIVFAQQPAAYLVHELFCHLLEADIFEIAYRRLMSCRISDGLSIVDDSRPYRSCFDLGEFDDCGNIVLPTTLVDHGRIQSFLSCFPEKRVGEFRSFGGNGRCENASFSVLPRMNFISTVFDDNCCVGDSYFADSNYIKVLNAYSGHVNPVSLEFNLHCSCVYVLNGKDVMFCPGATLRGSVVDLVGRIASATGPVASGLATCQKGNQSVLVGWSSPGLILNTENLRMT